MLDDGRSWTGFPRFAAAFTAFPRARIKAASRTMVALISEFYEGVSTGRLFEKSLMRAAGAFLSAWPFSTRAENRAGARRLPREWPPSPPRPPAGRPPGRGSG